MTVLKLVTMPDPYSMAWEQWVANVVGYNPAITTALDPDLPWQEFAQQLCLALPTAPMPDGFDDWQSWGAALKSVFKL